MRQQPHSNITRRIYNGIDPDEYASEAAYTDSRKTECIIAFAGRLIHGKGPDYLIEAVSRLNPTRPVRLVIAGDGPDRSRLETLAKSLKLEHAIEFAGLVHDMPMFWHACDVVVVPSAEFIEACPLTVLEAMASGKPVVGTRNGGIPELIVDGVTGSLVPPSDSEALTTALARYVASEELRLSHGAAGKMLVTKEFHIGSCAQAYLALFDELAAT